MKHLASLTLFLGSLLLAASLHGQDTSGNGTPSRNASDVLNAVRNELLFDSATPADQIDVSIDDGVITLKGSVANALARDRAERLAETVLGVQRVVNELSVTPAEDRADEAIAADIRSALLVNPATEPHELEVEVSDGHVSLRGTVDSHSEKLLAEKVAKSVDGVVEIGNEVEIDYPAGRADPEISAEVRELLRWDALIHEDGIRVTTEEGGVILTGAVPSLAEKSRAKTRAWVAGVRAVDASGLRVDSENRVRGTAKVNEDEAIKAAIEASLKYDADVAAERVEVVVIEGAVDLRGTVDVLAQAHQAEEIARNTTGVTRVENSLEVDPSPFDDEVLAENAREALRRAPAFGPGDVSVEVEDDVATLTGKVVSNYESTRATQVVSGVEGIRKVNNELRTDPFNEPWVYNPYVGPYGYHPYTPLGMAEIPSRPDGEIEDAIRSELLWSPFVDAAKVNVIVENGDAFLSGEVDSLAEMDAAIENAYEGGARVVNNELTLASD